ncbi:tail fiber [Synechococcus phage ACG-2014f]|uniref:Tail fiber n=1 Tax=Synechococcus phage ACG-2014f TaxID=1493511 RepID=A0A0E3G341_9CAUD|nr:tail fiber [Synechococcus phage ACG-2014f]
MAFKINGVVRIDNSGNGFLGIVTATDANITGVLTATEVDAKVSSKAITEQTDGTVDDVTGADELLLLDAETGGLLRVSIDEFVQGSGIGTLVTDFDNLTVTGITTVATLKGIGSNNISVGSTLSFADGTEIIMGDSGDFSIHHDGDHTYLDETGQGNLKLRTNNFRVTNIAETKPAITAQVTSGVELYFDGNKKIETTNTGVLVSGMLTADRLRSGDIAARNVITLGITTIQDHLEVNDSTGSGTEYNLNVKTNGSSTFGVLGNGNILLGNSSGAPFMATNDHHATSKKYVDDAIDDSVSYIGASAWGSVAADGSLRNGLNCTTSQTSGGVYQVTFTTPLSNANYAITGASSDSAFWVKDGSETVNGFTVYIVDVDGNSINRDLSFAVFSANAIVPPSGVGADAWGTFSGTTGDLQAGMNISSTTRTALGEYDVEFITEMPSDSEYAVTAVSNASQAKFINIRNKSTSGFKVVTRDGSGNISDGAVSFAVHASSTVTPTYTWTRDGTTLKTANDGDDVEVNGRGLFESSEPADYVVRVKNTDTGTINPACLLLDMRDVDASNNYSALRVVGYNTTTGLDINSDGAITAQGQITANVSNQGGENSAIKAIQTNSNGYAVWVGDGPNSTDRTASIGPDGRATFSSGKISLGPTGSGTFADNNIFLQSDGQVRCTNVITSSALAGSGTRPLYVDSSGGLTISSSDRSLKTNITTLPDQIQVVKALNPVSFNWIEKERLGAGLEIGFIAQEVEEIVPEVVRSTAGILSVDYAKLTATLTSALQAALTRIEALEAKVQSLEEGVTPD